MKKKIIPIIPIIAGAKEFAPDHMQPDKRKKAQEPASDISIGGDVSNSNIIQGDNNAITQQQIEHYHEAPLQGIVSTLFTIPPPVTDFTGREEELKKLKNSFSNGAIITGVTGGGGIGKTELARKLAQEIADDYPDARMSINLLGASENPMTPEDAMRRFLEPFYPNQKLPDEPGQLKGLFQQTFAAHKALLLLDNAANAAQARPLIPPKPSAVIVTSRQYFSLTESGLNPLRLDVLSAAGAGELLRTASVKMKDATDEEVGALAKLCGYLPLALRVAASILDDSPNWKAAALIARLRDERTRLKQLKREGDRDLDVETALSLSYQLLDDDLKKYFRKLSVFTASFPNISAQAVWQMTEEDDLEGVLNKLVNRSLLNYLPAQEGEGGLYDLHDLTRLFGVERLIENEAEAKDTVMAHANHFLEWAGEADSLYLQGNENILLGLARFRFIWPHLISAYERCLPEHTNFPHPDSADAWLSNFPSMCAYLLDLHLPPRQKIPILEAALEAARRLGEKQAEGVHLGNLGNAYAALGDARKAIEFYEQALVIDREIGDRRGEGAALGNLGMTYKNLGEKDKACQLWQEALAIFRAIESPHVKLVEQWLADLDKGKDDQENK